MIDHGTGSIPKFVDIDGDGLTDMFVANFFAYKPKLPYIYITLSEKKSQDRKEDRTENPEGSQDQSGFLLFA